MGEPPEQQPRQIDTGGGDSAGRDIDKSVRITINPPADLPPDPLEAARALLAALPLDTVPAPQTLPALHRMPLPPNPLFVGREAELRRIARLLKAGGTVAVTTGIGGVGKTQLAVEAAHRYGRFFAGGVFWLNFADSASIPGEVAACAQCLDIYTEGQSHDALVQRVRTLWESELPRLLIFDNCEDERLLREWKPNTGACRVLVTSRRLAWSSTLGVQRLRLETLPPDESAALLRQHRPDLSDADAAAIAAELGHLPLALQVAGSFLKRYARRTTPAAYLAELRGVDPLTHPSLRGRGAEVMPTDREPNVEKAFALSFARLDAADRIDALARALLARAALLAPGEPFERELLLATLPQEPSADPLDAEDALARLLDLGLAEEVAGADTLRLHRLLAAYARQMAGEPAARQDVEQALISLANTRSERRDFDGQQRMLPHLRPLAETARTSQRQDLAAAALWNALGRSARQLGNYQEALDLHQRALALREQTLDPQHTEVIESLGNLAGVYLDLGQHAQAQELYQRVLLIEEQIYGSEHPETAGTLYNLARLHQEQGEYEPARLLYERDLAITERVLGSDHPSIAPTLHNLASLYQEQGEYEAARPLYERALAIYEQKLGVEHPSIATTLHNLASLYQDQGEYDAARPLYERALAIYERTLGTEHPETATTLHELARLHQTLDEYELARQLYERALAVTERVLGSGHSSTATTLHNLASLHQTQGEHEAARPLYERALAIYERTLGTEHPETAATLSALAWLHQNQDDYEAAQLLYERALAIRKSVLGPDHPHTATTLHNFAWLHHNQGNYDQALLLQEQAVHAFQKALGQDHHHTTTALEFLEELRILAASGMSEPEGPAPTP